MLFCLIYLTEKIHADKKANYAVKVTNIEISPNPVVSGDPATFKISATSGNLSFSLHVYLVLLLFNFALSFFFCFVLIKYEVDPYSLIVRLHAYIWILFFKYV